MLGTHAALVRSACTGVLLVLSGCSLDFDRFASDAGSDGGGSGGSPGTDGEQDAALEDSGHAGGARDADVSGITDAAGGDKDAADDGPDDAGPGTSDACVDDCETPAVCEPNPCGAHMTCSAVEPDDYACECASGYVEDGDACENVDECFEGTHTCHPSATCADTDGSYECNCPLGYVGGGTGGVACTPRIIGTDQSSCVVELDGRVQCWGDNTYGTLGDGTMTLRTKPTRVVGLTDVVGIKGGTVSSVCALIDDGTVQCWGSDLGGTYTDVVMRPAEVEGLGDVVAFDVGALSACAVVRGGTVECWGNNNSGQLGDGMAYTTPRATPEPVPGITDAVSVAVGQQHACALLADGTARCWGDNSGMRLGDGTTDASYTPVTVVGLSGATDLQAGEQDTCALLGNRRVKCWGADAPDGGFVTGITDAISVSVGRYLVFSILSSGQALNWIGVGATVMPTEVFPNVVSLGDGGDTWHACGLLSDGTATCAGSNSAGQLGDDSTMARTTPVTVVDLDLW